MNYKTKLIFIALLPIILISVATVFVVNYQSTQLVRTQGDIVEKMYLELKRTELENYIKLAEGAVTPTYNSNLKTRRTAQREATEILRKMSYGEDNYFFVYDKDGTNIVNPRLTYFVGGNWIGLKNGEGKNIVRDMIKIGQEGGGFYEHVWRKPSSGNYVNKLAIAAYLPRWGWMLGTGIYLDDVTSKVNAVQSEIQKTIRQTRIYLLLLMTAVIATTTMILASLQLSEQRLADAKLKKLTARIVEIQEDERKRVSRELHDSISQLLVSARYGIEAALGQTRKGTKIIQPIEKSMTTLDAAISEVRRISMDLRPSVLDDIGLAAALKGLGKEFEAHSKFNVTVDAQPMHDLLTDEAKTALYRVVQEALTNIAKHAQATEITITLNKTKSKIQLEIKDNGQGAALGDHFLQKTAGLGLRNMQERIDNHGGDIQFKLVKPTGFGILVSLPINISRPKA
ncbi:MAG: cache domain-containing protein [Amylibacter sp.]|nr:cache domain-containing protein [Amylibacter sp.]